MVTASNGLEIDTVQAAFDEKIDVVFVCSGNDVNHVTTAAHLATLRRLAHVARTLGGICTGAYVLARAGLLAGYACTIHWEYLTSLEYEFRNSRLTRETFVIDRDRVTCSGGVAPLHMMLNLISPQVGGPLVTRIAQQFAIEHIYKPTTLQKIAIGASLRSVSNTLSHVIFLMDSNIEDPLSQKELAMRAEVSTRQLQRLFRAQTGVTPLHYYLTLRLRRARQLLYQTRMSIVEVGLCCGFQSAAYFSKSYSNEFGIAPIHDRRTRLVQLVCLSTDRTENRPIDNFIESTVPPTRARRRFTGRSS